MPTQREEVPGTPVPPGSSNVSKVGGRKRQALGGAVVPEPQISPRVPSTSPRIPAMPLGVAAPHPRGADVMSAPGDSPQDPQCSWGPAGPRSLEPEWAGPDPGRSHGGGGGVPTDTVLSAFSGKGTCGPTCSHRQEISRSANKLREKGNTESRRPVPALGPGVLPARLRPGQAALRSPPGRACSQLPVAAPCTGEETEALGPGAGEEPDSILESAPPRPDPAWSRAPGLGHCWFEQFRTHGQYCPSTRTRGWTWWT